MAQIDIAGTELAHRHSCPQKLKLVYCEITQKEIGGGDGIYQATGIGWH